MNWIKVITLSVLMVGCGSNEFVPTKKRCSLKEHYADPLFQVQVNRRSISKHWHLRKDAVRIMRDLAMQNKCMKEDYAKLLEPMEQFGY